MADNAASTFAVSTLKNSCGYHGPLAGPAYAFRNRKQADELLGCILCGYGCFSGIVPGLVLFLAVNLLAKQN